MESGLPVASLERLGKVKQLKLDQVQNYNKYAFRDDEEDLNPALLPLPSPLVPSPPSYPIPPLIPQHLTKKIIPERTAFCISNTPSVKEL